MIPQSVPIKNEKRHNTWKMVLGALNNTVEHNKKKQPTKRRKEMA